MVYASKGGILLFTAQFVSSLAGLGLAILFANLASKEVYGTYKYILSVAGLVGALTLGGMNTAIVRSVARGQEGLFKNGFKINLKWNIGMFFLALGVAAYYFLNNNLTLGTSLMVIAFTYPILTSANIYNAFLTGRKEYKISSTLQVIRNLGPIFMVFIALSLTQNILIIVSTFLISSAFFTFILMKWVIYRFRPNNLRDDLSLNYAKHLSLMGLLTPVGNQIDSILLFHYLGAAPLAAYALATAIPDNIIGYFKNLHTLSLPKFSEKSTLEIKESLLKKTFILGLISFGIYLIYILFSPFLFSLLFPQYLESVRLSQLFAFNIVLSTLGILPAAYFDSQLEKKKKYIVVLTTNILKIGLMIILVAPFGIMGVIGAEMITRLIALILMFYLIYFTKKEALVTEPPTNLP